ncbi:response regulator [Falsiroseomonas sp. HW251]|uniref:response regulator n=1 Tax=Falsiroseomonas sp. HW251 TaxID=3390998 RepID=UPI003D31DE9E
MSDGGVCILVVDDEPDMADLFRQRFRREVRDGTYKLRFAASAEAALDHLRSDARQEPMLVLSDVNMPGIDGLALLQAIRHEWPDLPVVMVTAYGDDERRCRAVALGAADFLGKPVDFDHLKRRLRDIAPDGSTA